MTVRISWKWIKPYKEYNQDKVPSAGGVYEILVKKPNGKYDRKYVGSADDLKKRYGEHLSPNEQNLKVRNGVRTKECAFDYFEIGERPTRENVENWLYNHHEYPWNDVEPPGDGSLVEVIEEN